MTDTREMVQDRRAEYAFHDDLIYLHEAKRGLTRATVEEISAIKNEPDWMLQYRLRAYEHFLKRPMPTWTDGLDKINFDKIVYYRKPSEREEKNWDDVPDQIKDTFQRLGIPEAEQKFLSGVGAQYDSEVVYHSVKEELTKLGVVFMGTDQALIEYPDILRKYFGTVVPAEDNKFSALNGAVWSGGSFVYVPPGVDVPLPLQAYFRINGENTGQFERTLIVVDEGASVHYIEGCTAPIYATESLHVAVVEVVALARSKVRYTTIQNWSNDVYNLVTKRAHAYEDSTVEWIDANTGSRKTVKYPSIYLRGRGASADIISVAVAGKGQHQDTGAKAVHLAPDTRSRIVSKSVSKDGGRATYRGQVKVAPGATNAVASVRCDALMLDDLSRSDTYPYIDIQEDDTTLSHEATVGRISAGPGVLPDEPRPDRERGPEPHRPGLPGGVHQGAADGVRHRVQPPGEAGDGGVARVSVPPLSLEFVSEEAARAASLLAAEPAWLLAERLEAARRVATLPAENNQLFTPYLDLRAARFGDITVTATRRDVVTAGALPDGAAALVAVDGASDARRVLGPEATAAGLVIDTLANVLRDHPGLLDDAIRDGATLPAGRRVRAGAARGLDARPGHPRPGRRPPGRAHRGPLARGRSGHRIGRPDHRLPGRRRQRATARGAARRRRRRLRDGSAPSVCGGTPLELLLGDGASLEVAGLQDFDQDTIAIVNRHATLGEDARLQWALASVGAQLHRSRIDNLLVGRGSSVHQVEIGFGGGSQLFDLTSYTRHIGTDTTGDLLSKGVFTDRARGYIKGLIEIRQSATGTDSFLGEFGMLLAKRARSVTIPSLEIDQPNVRRAAHSSSVGPIDEAQIFYLESRGVDRETARRLIVLAFLEPVVARIPLPEAQERLRGLLEAKWPRQLERPARPDASDGRHRGYPVRGRTRMSVRPEREELAEWIHGCRRPRSGCWVCSSGWASCSTALACS